MKRIRKTSSFFFALLFAAYFSFFLFNYPRAQSDWLNSYRTRATKDTESLRDRWNKILIREEARSPQEYHFSYNQDEEEHQAPSPKISVLARLTDDHFEPKILGHFEVNSKGEIRTPLIPSKSDPVRPLLKDLVQRKKLDQKIRQLAREALLNGTPKDKVSNLGRFDQRYLKKHTEIHRSIESKEKISEPILSRCQKFSREVYSSFRVCFTKDGWAVSYRTLRFANQVRIQGFVFDPIRSIRSLIPSLYPGHLEIYRISTSDPESIENAAPYALKLSALPRPLDSIKLVYFTFENPIRRNQIQYCLGFLFGALVLMFFMWLIYRQLLEEEQLSHEKKGFMSAVSHELKTPLTSIQMFAEMLCDQKDMDPSKQKTYLQYIRDEGLRLGRLVNNILSFNYIEGQSSSLHLSQLDLQGTFLKLMESVHPLVRTSGFTLETRSSVECDEIQIRGNEDALTQIIVNLVENAIKFSQNAPKKCIEFTCERNDGHGILSVRDYGEGIKKEELDRIFTAFYRSENELKRKTKGTGLGLAIVKSLTKKLDYKIQIEAKTPGTEIKILIPRDR